MIRVREEAPSVRSGEQLVARPGVSDYLTVRVDGVPMHGREHGLLAELASVDLDRRPRHDVTCDPVGDDRVGEVISHCGAVWHVDRLSSSDREEWPEAEIGHAFHIAIRVEAGEVVECGNDGLSRSKDFWQVCERRVNGEGLAEIRPLSKDPPFAHLAESPVNQAFLYLFTPRNS